MIIDCLRSRRSLWTLAASLVLLGLVGSCAPGQPIDGGLEPPPDDVLAIHLFPDSVSLNPTEFVDFSAIAELNGGGNGKVPVEWEATGGTITADGRYTAGSTAGTYRVKGRHRNGKADSGTVVINSPAPGPVLTRINVTPSTAALLPGDTQPFAAVGVMSDGSSVAVSVSWSATAGTISGAGLYTAPASPGSYLVVALQQGGTFADTAQVTVTVPPPTLAAVVLTPPTASLEFGRTQQFAAVGQLSDGSSTSIPITWTATGGTINASGLYTAGNTAGSFRVIARSANGLADTSAVTVTAPTITAITLTPGSASLQSGQVQQFSVSATLSNGGTQSNPPVTWAATGGAINTSGLYTAGATAGSFRVIATSSSGRADTSAVTIATPTITAITVTPASASLTTGQTQQFSASATLSNGATQTNPAVTWTATGGTVSTGGLYTAGNTAGTFRVIAASGNGRADTSAVTLTAQTITAVTVTPATASLQTGQTQQFSASATLSGGGTQTNPVVTWSATGGNITTGGRYTAGGTAGSFRVIATAAGGAADTSSITLTAATVTAIVVTPGAANVTTGQAQQFSASATLSSGGTQANPSVTWSATGGTISASGLFTAGSTAGSFQVIAVQQGGTLADTSAVTVSTVASGPYPNRPASFTRSSELDFSQPVPPLPENVDRPISGAPAGWNVIYQGNDWTQITDATSPQSAPGVWRGLWPAGSYGGGVIGQGNGHGIGNVFTYAASGTNRLYMSMRVYFDIDASLWHPISNKFVNLEGNNSLILVQLREAGHWRHAEELGFSGNSFFVDNDGSAPGEAHIAGQVSNPAVPVRRWTQIEVLIDIPGRVFKIWQDGVLTTNATPSFASSVINTVGWNAFRGGGGETLSTDLAWRYDHFFIAW